MLMNRMLAPDTPMSPAADPEQLAREHLQLRFTEQPVLGALVSLLSGFQLRGQGHIDVLDRPQADRRRLVEIAEETLGRLEIDDEHMAIDAGAEVLCSDGGEIAPLESQHPHVQAHYRRLMQSSYNRINHYLAGRDGR